MQPGPRGRCYDPQTPHHTNRQWQHLRPRHRTQTLLTDFLREEVGLTGTHVGCEHGVCGACTILLDGFSARACLCLAVQADGREVTNVEGMGEIDALSPLQMQLHNMLIINNINKIQTLTGTFFSTLLA